MNIQIPDFKIKILKLFCYIEEETPKNSQFLGANGTIVSNNGWFQLYTISSKTIADKETDNLDLFDTKENRVNRIVDYITTSIESLFPNIPNINIRYSNKSAIINQLRIELIKEVNNREEFDKDFFPNSDLNNTDLFLSHDNAFGIPLINIIICNFDNTPSISSNPELFSHITKLCEFSVNFNEFEFLFVGFSASKYQETEKHSKKGFEKFKTELQKLFGYIVKEKFIWFTNSNNYNISEFLLQTNIKQINTKLIEMLSSTLNQRIKKVIDSIIVLKNEGPKFSHSSKFDDRTTPEYSMTPEILKSGLNSPISNSANTQCRKLQLLDIWYQWILEIINLTDLLAIMLFKIGLINESLLIYEQLLDNFKSSRDSFFFELMNHSFGFAALIASKDPLLLSTDCCIGDCKTHNIDNAALIQRNKFILPLQLNKLKLDQRSTYFDIIQLILSRKIYILLSIHDFQKINNQLLKFIRRFDKEITSKIDDFKFRISCHLWIFRLVITIAKFEYSKFNFKTVNSNHKYNTALSSIKTIFISSTFPRLIQFLGASESYDVWKHKPSAPKLPPDTNISPMEVQIALIKWATQCLSSILLNNLCSFEEFNKLEEELELSNNKYKISNLNNTPEIINMNSLIPNYSIFHLASKHLSIICQLLSDNIWYSESHSNEKNEIFEFLFQDFKEKDGVLSKNGDLNDFYDLERFCYSLTNPCKTYRMLCEMVGVAGMDYISYGQLRSAISLPWGILFDNKQFVDWILRIINNDEYLNEEDNSIFDICFCYRFTRIWLDFSTILLPIPFQWTNLSNVSQKLFLKLLAKKLNAISINYINFNDPYLLQAEIGIRLFLNQINKNPSPNEFNDQKILETYINKCLENSNIIGSDLLQWEFPAHPNLWAYISIPNKKECDFLEDNELKIKKFKMKTKIPYINSLNNDETSAFVDTQTKPYKGITLKIVEKQILMALLGGGRLIRLPNKALPCCGLLDPLKSVQGYFYVFHEILRPSGRLFLRSPYVLSPLQSPLGSTQQCKTSENNTGKTNSDRNSNQEVQKVEQQEVKDLSNNQKGKSSNKVGIHGNYNSWFQKKGFKQERSSSLSNSEIEHLNNDQIDRISPTLNKKKDGSPKQWMWEIVSGFKWGGNSYSGNSKNKNKSSSFSGSLHSERSFNSELNQSEVDLNKNSKINDFDKDDINIKMPCSKLNLNLKIEETSSPSKVITVPTPGPSNWVVTEAAKSGSKKSATSTPNVISTPKENTSNLISSPNSYICESVVTAFPLKCSILVYIGLQNTIQFNSIWLRINNLQWISLEYLSFDKQNVVFQPGLNQIDLDILYEGPTPFNFVIDSIGFSNNTNFQPPINFLWVIPLGTLPSPHILSKVILEFKSYESAQFKSNRVSFNKDEYEFNKDNIWNPLKKWTTLYLFKIKELIDVINLQIRTSEKTDNIELDNDKLLNKQTEDFEFDNKNDNSNVIKVQTDYKIPYIFKIKLDDDWTQVNHIEFQVSIDFFNSNNPSITFFLDEFQILSIDGSNLHTNQKLNFELNQIKIPKFLNECIIQIPIMFSSSPISEPKLENLSILLITNIIGYNIKTTSKFDFDFLIEPQTKLQKIQRVPDIDQLSLPFNYFELYINSNRCVSIKKIILAFPKEVKNSQLFNILAPVAYRVQKNIEFEFIQDSYTASQYLLLYPITIESSLKPLKLIWIVPKMEFQSNIKPIIYISSSNCDIEYGNSESISGPFEISIEKYQLIDTFDDSYSNLNSIYLESVEHPSQSKVDIDFLLTIHLNYMSNHEETFSYYLNYFNSENSVNCGNWWFIGTRNGKILAKPKSKIKLEFRIVPLTNGLLDLPYLHITNLDSIQNTKVFSLGKQVVL